MNYVNSNNDGQYHWYLQASYIDDYAQKITKDIEFNC